MTASTTEAGKIQALEGLRGLMAWWVVIGHISVTFGWNAGLLNRNGLAVDVFIILSGFVIARLVERKREDYLPYIVRRGFRIIPLYYAALAASAVLLPIQDAAWRGLPFSAPALANRSLLVEHALSNLPGHLSAHLSLLHGLTPPAFLPATHTILGQSWSVSLEWQFYLTAPLIMWALASARRGWIALAFVAVLVAASPYFTDGFLGAKIHQFLVGIFAYRALNEGAQGRTYLSLALIAAAACVLLQGVSQIVPLGIWTVTLISLASPQTSRMRWPAYILSSRLAAHFGEMSYSIYLIHMIPLYCSIVGLTALGFDIFPLQIGIVASTLAATYVLSRATYRYIEKPSIRLGASLVSDPGRSEIAGSMAIGRQSLEPALQHVKASGPER